MSESTVWLHLALFSCFDLICLDSFLRDVLTACTLVFVSSYFGCLNAVLEYWISGLADNLRYTGLGVFLNLKLDSDAEGIRL